MFLCFLKVIFIFATPYKRHPIGEDSLVRKILAFPVSYRASLFLCVTQHLCASALKSTAVFRITLLDKIGRGVNRDSLF